MNKKKPPALSSKFLVFLDGEAGRALLFDDTRRWVGEVIENDGYIVDTLLAQARACPLPDDIRLGEVHPPPPAGCAACCFELH